jgi:hypothetical protein
VLSENKGTENKKWDNKKQRNVNLHAQYFVHFEHIYLVAPKHTSQSIVAHDLALVGGVLEVIAFDVFPQMFHNLRPGELWGTQDCRKRFATRYKVNKDYRQ